MMAPMGPLRARAVLVGLVGALSPLSAAWADHFGLLQSAQLSPGAVGILAGLLALATGVFVVVIAMLLMRKRSPSK